MVLTFTLPVQGSKLWSHLTSFFHTPHAVRSQIYRVFVFLPTLITAVTSSVQSFLCPVVHVSSPLGCFTVIYNLTCPKWDSRVSYSCTPAGSPISTNDSTVYPVAQPRSFNLEIYFSPESHISMGCFRST